MSLSLWMSGAGWRAWPIPGAAAWRACLPAERQRLAPWLTVALGLGILGYFQRPAEPSQAALWLAPPLLLLAFWLAARRPLLGWALGLVAAAVLGFAAALWHAGRQPSMPDLPRGATLLGGRVVAVELLPEGRRLTLDQVQLDDAGPLRRHIRVRLRTEDPARPRPGDLVRLRALLRPPAAPAYPGAWDFQRAAWFSGLAGSGFAIGPAEVMATGEGGPPLAAFRTAIEARVTGTIPGAAGAIAAALLTGGQSAIPPGDLAALRDSGLAHLLSVSGLHIAIVMGVSFAVLRLLLALVPPLVLRLPAKAIAAVAALGIGGFYLLLTGAQVPMQRSFAMAALATLALLSGRRALSLRAWALAAAVVLLLQPAALLGASFQMSFAAVLALIAGWEWLRPRLPRPGPGGPRWRRRLALGAFGIVATSILAGAATTPFGLHHFGRIQLYGVAANALAVPVTSALVMPAGMAGVLLMPFGLEGLALAPMRWGVQAILAVAHWVASWPGATLPVPPIPAWGLGLSAFGLLWLCLWGTAWRVLGLPLMALGLASGGWQRPPDILVSADARLIALRSGEGVAVQRLPGASRLTQEIWLRFFAVEEATVLPLRGTLPGLDCSPAGCTYRPVPEAPAVVLLRAGAPTEACAAAALVISAEPVRGRCAARVIDRFSVWRHGAHAVWLERDGMRVVSDRAARGARPWVPPVPAPRGAPSQDPPAQVE